MRSWLREKVVFTFWHEGWNDAHRVMVQCTCTDGIWIRWLWAWRSYASFELDLGAYFEVTAQEVLLLNKCICVSKATVCYLRYRVPVDNKFQD